jgi:hypothetical protein
MQTQQARRAGKQVGATNVGDETDPDFRHRDLGAVGDHADARMGTDPKTAAHHDAVHQRHVRLGVAADVGVEEILVAPEPPRLDPVGAGAVIDRDYVAAGAQAPLAGAGQHHRVHVVVVLPIPQHLVQVVTIERVSELIVFGRFRVRKPTPPSTSRQDLIDVSRHEYSLK